MIEGRVVNVKIGGCDGKITKIMKNKIKVVVIILSMVGLMICLGGRRHEKPKFVRLNFSTNPKQMSGVSLKRMGIAVGGSYYLCTWW